MDGITIEVLQTWFPTLQKQEELQKLVAIYTIFEHIPVERLEKYASIIQELSALQDHGDADVEIQVRNGEIQNEMYGKRVRRC